ncbi:hypothetical protein KC207_08750 [Phycicoccus sp. BSK3Z-2]|uniref:Uncharacterized protein n=1 Tax=Phycicoccus avicenniae TaxID=2828860 RepID=A0A941I0M5_9MICO|nr:hypothetical protein [Phycicoccus avicenniae]MBR7743376.1 hypothetical protein [Phycicoccus avicenniae]
MAGLAGVRGEGADAGVTGEEADAGVAGDAADAGVAGLCGVAADAGVVGDCGVGAVGALVEAGSALAVGVLAGVEAAGVADGPDVACTPSPTRASPRSSAMAPPATVVPATATAPSAPLTTQALREGVLIIVPLVRGRPSVDRCHDSPAPG